MAYMPRSWKNYASNPCSEYMFIDDGLQPSLYQFLQFKKADLSFDIEAYEYTTRLWTLTLEISVMMAQSHQKRSHKGLMSTEH